MRKYFCYLTPFLCLLLLFSGCKNEDSAPSEDTNSVPSDVTMAQSDSEMFTERDMDFSFDQSSAVKINLGETCSCDSDLVDISGSKITIKGDGVYILSGTLSDGSVIVNCDDTAKPQIVLNNASITSRDTAPLCVLQADKVFLTLAEGTENSLSNGGAFSSDGDTNIDGAIFSKDDITINGKGSLSVTSPSGHGIVCKDDLKITGGDITVSSSCHGLDANDSIRISTDHSVTITSGKDGIHAENSDDASLGFVYISKGTFNVKSGGDGISAVAYLQLINGSFDITAGGGSANGEIGQSDSYGKFMGTSPQDRMSPNGNGFGNPFSSAGESDQQSSDSDGTSMKGIKCAGNIDLSQGTYKINSADDGIHSDSSATINGGNVEIASGDDGIHAEESLKVTGGTIKITESYEGLEALNIAISDGDITVNADDDGLNAAGGNDSSGMGGRDNGNFGPTDNQNNGMPGGMSQGNGSIVISGGKIYIKASGDGIDANGTVEITGGHITVCGPTQGDTSTMDYDKTATISGGTFIGTGALGMAQSFSTSPQGIIALSVGNQSANTPISICNSNGNEILCATPSLSYQVVILSSPDIIKGESYTVKIGDLSESITAE